MEKRRTIIKGEKIVMEIYNNLRRPPKEALKQITGGRLKGMTDINPQWRYEALTEQFGPCGVGWRFEIVKLWLEYADKEVCAFAQVDFYFKQNDQWSMAVPGVGGSKLVSQEKAGLYVSDEAYKMAITDALSTAVKLIGVGADIYSGSYNGSKYTAPPTKNVVKNEPVVQGDNKATPEQVKTLYEIANREGLTTKEFDALANWYKTGKRVSQKEAEEMINDLNGILNRYLDYLEKIKGGK